MCNMIFRSGLYKVILDTNCKCMQDHFVSPYLKCWVLPNKTSFRIISDKDIKS